MSEKNVKARSGFQGRFIAEQKDGSAPEAFGIHGLSEAIEAWVLRLKARHSSA